MQTILTVLHLFLALGLIGLVLIQHGKGADMGAAFGSGASATVFGARGSGSFLSRATAVLATVFFLTSMALAYFAAQVGEPEGLMDRLDQVPVAPVPAEIQPEAEVPPPPTVDLSRQTPEGSPVPPPPAAAVPSPPAVLQEVPAPAPLPEADRTPVALPSEAREEPVPAAIPEGVPAVEAVAPAPLPEADRTPVALPSEAREEPVPAAIPEGVPAVEAVAPAPLPEAERTPVALPSGAQEKASPAGPEKVQ